MKKTLTWCAVALALVGCSPGSATPPPAPQPTALGIPVDTPTPAPAPTVTLTSDQLNGLEPPADFFDGPYAAEGTRVFDYAEATAYFYRCDPCTVDSIVGELGAPVETYGQHDEIGSLWVELRYPATTISVAAPDDVSFAKVGGDANIDGLTKHPLTAADRALTMRLLTVETTDPGATLPRGLRIGATRDQVAAAYPAGSALLDEDGEYGNTLYYAHVWFDDLPNAYAGGVGSVGGVDYEFDDDNLMISAAVSWTVLEY